MRDSEGLRALKRRLVPCAAYADSYHDLRAAIKKFRSINDAAKHPVRDAICAHECGHAIVTLYFGMQLQFIKVGPNGNKIEGVRGSGGCGILPVAMKLSDFLTVLVAGVVAGYKYCRTVIGEADVSSERIFADSTDAGLIKEVLSSGASTQEWDTALHQLTMGLRVTAQLNEHEIATLRDAVQDAEKILNKHDRALKMLARALWKNRGKDSEAYASISKEEIDAIWVKERQV